MVSQLFNDYCNHSSCCIVRNIKELSVSSLNVTHAKSSMLTYAVLNHSANIPMLEVCTKERFLFLCIFSAVIRILIIK